MHVSCLLLTFALGLSSAMNIINCIIHRSLTEAHGVVQLERLILHISRKKKSSKFKDFAGAAAWKISAKLLLVPFHSIPGFIPLQFDCTIVGGM